MYYITLQSTRAQHIPKEYIKLKYTTLLSTTNVTELLPGEQPMGPGSQHLPVTEQPQNCYTTVLLHCSAAALLYYSTVNYSTTVR